MSALDPDHGAAVDFADMQGLVRFGHARLTEAEFLLLEIADADAARAWLRAAPVTSANWCDPPPERALQLALSPAGLAALGLAPRILAQFPQPFLAGMGGEKSRSRRLGDVGPNAPEHWEWGREPPHLLLMLYARPGQLAGWHAEIEADPFARAFRIARALSTTPLRGREPFGFVDGISEPKPDWASRQSTNPKDRPGYSNLVAPGEIVLGYRNEYGLLTPRPLVEATAPGAAGLPPAEGAPGRFDLGRNGAFLAFRHLEQDVRGFWRFLDQVADGMPERRTALAECMIGRHLDGPALIAQRSEVPGAGRLGDFNYDRDPDGLCCPLGAHVRRANPRTGDHPPGVSDPLSRALGMLGFRRRRDKLPGRFDLVAAARYHRLARRGREFGPSLSQEEALHPASGGEEAHGIHFICLCANLVRQFEFVQNAWLAGGKFNGLYAETDPLLGNRQPLPGGLPTDRFSIPQASGVTERLGVLPQFVTVRGGAYFFLPGLRALRFLAGPGDKEEWS